MAKVKQQQTFRDLYLHEKSKPTAAAQFIAKMANEFGRDEVTIRMWLSGSQQPNKDIVPQIEKYFGADIYTLFPNAKYDNRPKN